MLTRRETVLGGALTLLWGDCACGAQPGMRPHGFGCTLEPAQADAFLATATRPQTFSDANTTIITTSGNRDFDFALAQTLSRLTDRFGVLPGFCFYDDYDGMNAMATLATPMRRADGTVLFGKRLFIEFMGRSESPEMGVIAATAHEFGHIVQFKHRLIKQLNAGQNTVKRSELNADFFSGYFAGTQKLRKPDFPAAVFATNRFSRGDFNTNSQHHGTPAERAAAVVRGFEVAYRERRSFADAIGIGVNYAKTL